MEKNRFTFGEDVDTDGSGHHVEETEKENTTNGTPRNLEINLTRGNAPGVVVHPGCTHSTC